MRPVPYWSGITPEQLDRQGFNCVRAIYSFKDRIKWSGKYKGAIYRIIYLAEVCTHLGYHNGLYCATHCNRENCQNAPSYSLVRLKDRIELTTVDFEEEVVA